jgi:hypothetical protein
MGVNIKTILKSTLLLLVVGLLCGGLYLYLRPNTVPLQGVLRSEGGLELAEDGRYQMRVVAFNTENGKQILAQDFDAVSVRGGQYTLPIQIPKYATTGDTVFQVCRTADPTAQPEPVVADGCREPVEKQQVLTLAECPQTLEIAKAGAVFSLLGARTATIGGGCSFEADTIEAFATDYSSIPSVVGIQGEKGDTGESGVAGADGQKGDTGAQGPQGPQGEPGVAGSDGAPGATGPAGDPATDDQTLSFGGVNILSIAGGNSVDLSVLADNTDVLAGLSCTVGQIAQFDGSVWACASPAASTDSQTLSLAGSNLSILNGNSVSLAGFLDNTDAQAISVASNVLSISGNASTVNLAPYLDNTDNQALSLAGNSLSLVNGGSVSLLAYLDNTDAQDLSLAGNTLSLTGDGTSVSLAGYLDNTDAQTLSFVGNILTVSGGNSIDLSALAADGDTLAGLSCGLNQIAKWNGSVWACANDVDTDTVLSEAQVDAYVANNGYLTSEVDGSTTNEIQDLSLAGTTLSLTSDGTSVSLASFMDNTDVLASLSCSPNQIAKWNGSAWACAVDVDTDTDTQDLSLASNTLSLVNGGSVDLSPYLDNTDTQDLSLVGNTLSLVDGGSVDLSTYLDDTVLNEAQVDAYVANNGYLTSEVDGSTTNEIQDLTLTGDTLALSGDGTTVDLSTYLDNTDVLASLSCGLNQIAKWNGSAWACAADIDTDTDTQDLTLGGNTLSLVNGGSVDLSPYLDNTDAQDLSLAGSTLSLTGDGTTVSLATFLDNTDVLAGLSCSPSQIPKWNGSAWACAADVDTVLNESQVDAYIANNGYLTTEVDGSVSNELQDLTLASNVLGLTSSGVTFDLSAYLDNTDAQSISVAGNVLSISGNASTVDLSPYLDNTDTQDLSLVGDTLSLVAGGSVDLSAYMDDTVLSEAQVDTYVANNGYLTSEVDGSTSNEIQDLSLAGDTLALSGDGTTVDLSAYMDNTDVLAGLSCGLNQIAKWNGSAWACAADADTDTDTQDLSLAGNTLSLVAGGSVDLTAFMDNTDSQDLSLAGNILSLSGDGTTVDLSGYLDDTVLSEAQVDTYVANNGYLTSEVDGSTTNELQNVFTTIATPDANNPAADTTTDTLTLANGSGVTITSNGTTDTITIAAALGTDIDSTEIVNGTITSTDISGTAGITNGQLANSSLTVSAGNGLLNGGSVSLGGITTLNIGAGNGITVNADDIAVRTAASADGLSSTTSSGSGIEALATGVALLQGCSDAQVLKWNETTDVWACAADNDTIISEATVESYIFDADNTGTLSSGTLALGSLSYTGTLSDTQISDTLTIGATSTVSDSALSANVSKLGSDISSAEIANGTIAAADVAPDALDFTELNDTMSLDVATSISLGANDLTFTAGGAGNVVTNLSSTGDFIVQDNGTTAFIVQDNGGVYIGDPASAIATGSLLVLDSITTAPGSPVNGAMYYDSGLAKFRCYESSTWKDCISAPGSQNDTAATYYFFSDFIGNPTTTTGQDVYATNSGTGAATAASANVAANRPGIFRSTTGTTATGRTAFASNLTAFALGGGAMSYETAVNIATLSTGTERYQLVIGLFDTATAANQVDAVSFVYDEGGVSTGSAASANWQIRTASNSTRSWTTTTTAVAAATWYKLRVEVNAAGTSATFYINGTNVGTIATNIPTGTARALGFGHLMIKSVGTTARTMDIDYMKAEQSFTTSR